MTTGRTSEVWSDPRGFTKYPNAMFGRFESSPTAVWLALHRFAHFRNGARPKLDTVIAMTGLRRTAVKHAIHEVLVPNGVLTVTSRGNGSLPNHYGFPDQGGTFTQWPNLLWKRDLVPRQIVVLLALLRVKDLAYGAMPEIRDIAARTKTGKNTVGQAVKELEHMGLITVERRGTHWNGRRLTHRYTFPWLETGAVPAVAADTPPVDLDTRTCVIPETGYPGTRERPPRYPTAATPVPGGGLEEDLSIKTDEEILKVERLSERRAARGGAAPAAFGFSPPAAGPGGGGAADLVGLSSGGTSWEEREVPGPISSSKYRNYLRDSVDAERIVSCWEEVRGPAPSPQVLQRWVRSAYQLLAEDGRPVEEVLWLIRWVAADDRWSRRVKTLGWLRGGGGDRYADLVGEAKNINPSAPGCESQLGGVGLTASAANEEVSAEVDASLDRRADEPLASLRARLALGSGGPA